MSTLFSEISYVPETKKLSILDQGNNTLAGPYDLSSTAVKIRVVKNSGGGLEYDLETGPVGSFSTDKYALRIKHHGATNNTKMSFGVLPSTWNVPLGDHSEIAFTDEFYAYVIGIEDIRNGRTGAGGPKNLLLMQDQILSFEIGEDGLLNLRYHDTISA